MERNGVLKKRTVSFGGDGVKFCVEKIESQYLHKFGGVSSGYYLVIRNKEGFITSLGSLTLTESEVKKYASEGSKSLVEEAKKLFDIS